MAQDRSRRSIRNALEDPNDDARLRGLLDGAFGGRRLAVLRALQDKPLRFSQVAKEVPLSQSEISRNLATLLASGLVTKQSSGAFEATPAARVIFELLPAADFVSRHLEFVNHHRIADLPPVALRRLDDLAFARLVEDPFTIYGHLEHMFRTVRKKFDGQWIVGAGLGQQQLELHQLAKNRLRETGAKARTVMLRHELATMLKQSDDFLAVFETRVIDAAPTSVAMTEKAAIVWFESEPAKIDFNAAFLGDDTRFLAWAGDLFEHYWSQAEPVLARKELRGR